MVSSVCWQDSECRGCAGTAPEPMGAVPASAGCSRYRGRGRWEFLCGNVRGSALLRMDSLSSDGFVLAEFTPPHSERVPEFNQSRTLEVSTAENFHVAILARKRKKKF